MGKSVRTFGERVTAGFSANFTVVVTLTPFPEIACSIKHARSRRRVHQFIHQPQPGHGVLGIAHRAAIARGNLLLCEFCAQRRSAHQQRHADSGVLQIVRGNHHLLRAFHQQTGESDRVRVVRLDTP